MLQFQRLKYQLQLGVTQASRNHSCLGINTAPTELLMLPTETLNSPFLLLKASDITDKPQSSPLLLLL